MKLWKRKPRPLRVFVPELVRPVVRTISLLQMSPEQLEQLVKRQQSLAK